MQQEPSQLSAIFQWCLEHWSFVLFALGIFIQFTPAIKFSPITAICKWIGKAINGEVIQRITGLEARADQQRKSIDENEMDRIRWKYSTLPMPAGTITSTQKTNFSTS